MNKRIEVWLKSMLASVIGGAANAGAASLGIGAANMLGFKVTPLDLKQLGDVCLSGAIVGLILYLKQSPVPADSTGNTQVFVKQDTQPPTTSAARVEDRN